MKGYLYIYQKSKNTVSYKRKIEKIFSIFYNKEVDVKESISRNHLFYNFSNENDNLNQYQVNDTHLFGLSGYLTSPISDIQEGLILSSNTDEYILDIGGVFSLTHLNIKENIFKAWNNITRVEPIYWSENNDVIVVGNRAILVHLISMNIDRPEYNISSFASFLNNGYYADEKTPFEKLNILPVNSKITIQNQKVTISQIDNTLNNLYSIKPNHEFYDEITDDYINSFKPLLNHDQQFSLGLTGGKDSRLIVAALNNLGVDLQLFTNGYEDTPDVIVAKNIASILNKEHITRNPSKNNSEFIIEDIGIRAKNMIQNSDGMLFAYEGMSVSNEFNFSKVQLGGQGGELLRGGFAKDLTIESRKRLEQLFNLRFGRFQKYLNPELSNHYSDFNKEYIQYNLRNLSVNDVLNKHYLEFKCGRWSAAGRTGYTSGFFSYAPMFDAKLVRKAQLLETQYGADDSLIYNILMRLEPRLLDIPFAGDRWNFEKFKPYSKYDTFNWNRKKPIYSKTAKGSFNWRKNVLKNLNDEFYEAIFSDPNNKIFDIVDKKQLMNMFENLDEKSNINDNFLWSVFTASHLLSNNWFDKDFDMSHPIELKIPKNALDIKERYIPKSELVPPASLSNGNNQIDVIEIDNNASIISWNNTTNSNLYIRIFDNSFDIPPTEYPELTFIENSEKISIEFDIEKHRRDDFLIKVYMMQYDDEKVVNRQSKSFEVMNKLDTYKFEVTKHEKAKYFKPAIQILNKNSIGSFTIQGMTINK